MSSKISQTSGRQDKEKEMSKFGNRGRLTWFRLNAQKVRLALVGMILLLTVVGIVATAEGISSTRCPWCGNEVRLEKAVAPVPNPFPQSETGTGCWIYKSRNQDAMLKWMAGYNINTIQYWSHAYNGHRRGLEYCFEMQPSAKDKDGNHKRKFDMADDPRAREALERHLLSPLWKGVTLDCEVGFTKETIKTWALIREIAPHIKIYTGPLSLSSLKHRERYREYFDGLVSYMNCTRYTRKPEDVWFQVAIARGIGLPLAFSVQPVDSEKNMYFADPVRFKAAMKIAAGQCRWMPTWKLEGIHQVAMGWRESVNPERLPVIMDIIANTTLVPEERIELKIHTPNHGDAETFNKARSLARAVGMTGVFVPVAVLTAEEADLTYAEYETMPGYNWKIILRFSQFQVPKPERPAAREACDVMERKLASAIRARFGG